jgi:hypothetical protein
MSVEVVHVSLASADLVSDALPVRIPHQGSGLSSVLQQGQDVVVTDLDGEFHGGLVLDVVGAGGPDDAVHYMVKIGARLPIDLAAERLTDFDLMPTRSGDHAVVDLLGELRERWQAQRPTQTAGPDVKE